MGTSQEAEQRHVPVRKQESNCQGPQPIGGSERNKRTLWSVYGSSQIEPGHRSEECSWELQVYSDSQGIVFSRWIHPSMY